MVKEQRTLAILGAGYTGRFLYPLAARRYRVMAGSRTPHHSLSSVPHAHRIEFDLHRDTTWQHVPGEADLIWCFPARPLDQVRACAKQMEPASRRMVVLGSTSAYDIGASNEYPPPWLDETSSVDLTKPRVQGEEYLRQEHGAIVLRVAGIYGPRRNPLDWIRQGRIGPSRKYVNVIHVEDLAAICLAALERGTPGAVYNVSDGQPRTWEDICRSALERWKVQCSIPSGDRSPGKRISNTRLVQTLGYTIRYPDLYDILEKMESGRS